MSIEPIDEGLIEDMLQSRAWRLFASRIAVELTRAREANESDKVIPETQRYLDIGRIAAYKTALQLPELLMEEARAIK